VLVSPGTLEAEPIYYARKDDGSDLLAQIVRLEPKSHSLAAVVVPLSGPEVCQLLDDFLAHRLCDLIGELIEAPPCTADPVACLGSHVDPSPVVTLVERIVAIACPNGLKDCSADALERIKATIGDLCHGDCVNPAVELVNDAIQSVCGIGVQMAAFSATELPVNASCAVERAKALIDSIRNACPELESCFTSSSPRA
jgi:hypothetical protein